MSRGGTRATVRSLAKELFIEADELLIALWEAGYGDVLDPDSELPARQLDEIRSKIGQPTLRQQTRIDYWVDTLNITRQELVEELDRLGFKVSAHAKSLPKDSLRKLQRRYLDPATPTPLSSQPLLEFTEVPIEQDAMGRPVEKDAALLGRPPPLNWEQIGHSGEIRPDRPPPLKWEQIGHLGEIRHLAVDDVLAIHQALVHDFARTNDPISPPGVRDDNLLASALSRPKTSLGGELKYKTIELAGGALLHSLALNHAFHNGNKRTALVSLLAFLDKNSFFPTCSEEELFKITLRLATHSLVPSHYDSVSDREVRELARWIRASTRRVDRAEHPMPWHRLLRILRSHNCESDVNTGVGARINLTRTVEKRRGLLGLRKETVVYTVQVHYGGKGSEVEKNTVHHVRQRLHLLEDDGYDSAVFYEDAMEPDYFIQSYRTVLRRLARV